jgi:anti-sigma B factor antagonist
MAVYHPRPMKVDVRNSDDVIIVDLSGRLVAGDGADVLHEVINTLLADDWAKIILNMSDVSMIDSTGAGELIESLKIAEKFNSKIKLLRPQERVQKSLQLSQLLPLFEVFDEEDEAIRAFSA